MAMVEERALEEARSKDAEDRERAGEDEEEGGASAAGADEDEDVMEEVDLSDRDDHSRRADRGARFREEDDDDDDGVAFTPTVARATKPDRMDDDVMFRFKHLA